MSFHIVAEQERMIEPALTTPIYYDGLGPIQNIDGIVHIVLWAEQPSVAFIGTMDRIVVARLLVSVKAAARNNIAMRQYLETLPCERTGKASDEDPTH